MKYGKRDSNAPAPAVISAELHSASLQQTPKHKLNMTVSTVGLSEMVIPDAPEPSTHVPSDSGRSQVGSFRGQVMDLEQRDGFRNFITCMIWINLLQFGASVQWTEKPWKSLWGLMDHFFTCVFVAEMLIKLISYRCAYFKEASNVVDFVLALISIFGSMMTFFGNDGVHLSAFRILRLFRALRVARALKRARSLALLIEGIAESVAAMCWIGVLVFVVIYLLAIICIALFDVFGTPPGLTHKFSSVPTAMLALFNMVLLTEWTQIIWPVSKSHPWMVVIFTAFIVFSNFGVMNVAIGIVVERANAVANRQREEDVLYYREQQMQEVHELKEFFVKMDTDCNKRVSKSELKDASREPTFQDTVKRMGLPAGFTLADLYIMLDHDANGYLTGNEFVKGMFRLVHSNEFQRSCMIHCIINEVKHLVLQNRESILEAIKDQTQQLSAEMKLLLAGRSALIGGGHDASMDPDHITSSVVSSGHDAATLSPRAAAYEMNKRECSSEPNGFAFHGLNGTASKIDVLRDVLSNSPQHAHLQHRVDLFSRKEKHNADTCAGVDSGVQSSAKAKDRRLGGRSVSWDANIQAAGQCEERNCRRSSNAMPCDDGDESEPEESPCQIAPPFRHRKVAPSLACHAGVTPKHNVAFDDFVMPAPQPPQRPGSKSRAFHPPQRPHHRQQVILRPACPRERI